MALAHTFGECSASSHMRPFSPTRLNSLGSLRKSRRCLCMSGISGRLRALVKGYRAARVKLLPRLKGAPVGLVLVPVWIESGKTLRLRFAMLADELPRSPALCAVVIVGRGVWGATVSLQAKFDARSRQWQRGTRTIGVKTSMSIFQCGWRSTTNQSLARSTSPSLCSHLCAGRARQASRVDILGVAGYLSRLLREPPERVRFAP